MAAVVLETGTAQTRAGMALATEPKVCRRTAVGENCPIQKGVVTRWDDLETLWSDVLMKELKVNPEEKNVLIIDSAVPNQSARQKMAEILAEKLNVKGFFFGIDAVLTLYASGRLGGVVLETGESEVHAVPVKEGFAIPSAVTKLGMGGSEQTDYLGRVLREKGHDLDPATLRDIKEKLGYVAKNFNLEKSKSGDADFAKTYDLPDGKKITLGLELAETGEMMFNPSAPGVTSGGVKAVVNEAIGKCESDIQQVLKSNIVLGGGPSVMTGFDERVKKEMNAGPADVIASPNRANSAFLGGSILVSLEDMQKLWVTRDEYKEKGFQIVTEKCK